MTIILSSTIILISMRLVDREYWKSHVPLAIDFHISRLENRLYNIWSGWVDKDHLKVSCRIDADTYWGCICACSMPLLETRSACWFEHKEYIWCGLWRKCRCVGLGGNSDGSRIYGVLVTYYFSIVALHWINLLCLLAYRIYSLVIVANAVELGKKNDVMYGKYVNM